jgi:uncharacterized protein (TIGR02266 family)
MQTEKRTSLRVPLTVSVVYWVNRQERKETYRVESVNIGEGGIFIKTDLPLGIGTEVHLKFSLPGDNASIQLSGKVAWSGSLKTYIDRAVWGKGIRFTAVDDENREKLMKFVKEQATG